MSRHLFILSLGAMLACGPAVATPGADDSSTGGDRPPGESSGGSATTSATPNPSSATDPAPPQTSTDPFDPTTGGFGDTEASSTDECGFIICDETGSEIDDCDVFEQNCPRGKKCTPWNNKGGNTWNATRCVPVADDPDAPGQPCTVEGSPVSGIDSCELGSMCWDVDPATNSGTCVPHCTGSPGAPTCDDPYRVCHLTGDGILTLCLPGCDPLTDTCPESQGCYPYNNQFVCAPDSSGEGGGPFEACEYTNGCDPGTVCVPSEAAAICDSGDFCCSLFCSLQAPDCPDAMVCFPYYEEGTLPPGGSADIGFCVDADS